MFRIWSKEIVETKNYLRGGITTIKTETRIFTIAAEEKEKKGDKIKEKISKLVEILRRNKGNENKIQKA